MDNKKQQELQERYIELQLIDQQIKQFQQQLQTFDSKLQELVVTHEALKSLNDTKSGTKILVPVSSGIFVDAELKDVKQLKLNIGADVSVVKSLPETQKLVDEQIDEIQKYRDQTSLQLNVLVGKAQEIESKISKMG